MEPEVHPFRSPTDAWHFASARPLGTSAALLVLALPESEARDLVHDALSVAEPGELLGDRAFWELIQSFHPIEDTVVERGVYELGLQRRQIRLYRVGDRAPLPPYSRSGSFFIGRKQELTDAKRFFELGRMLSIVGPVGVGKSSFMARLASDLEEDFDRSYWIDLTHIDPSEPLGPAITRLLNFRKPTDQTSEEALSRFIGERPVLLSLDGIDGRLDEVGETVSRLMSSCRNLAVLTASVFPVQSGIEIRYGLPGMQVADPNADLESVQDSDAVALFIDRAQEFNPEFRAHSRNIRSIAELAKRLEGNPLAIISAAQKTTVLGPQQIINRLSQSLYYLEGPVTRALERWQNLLSDPARKLLQDLVVFQESFSLDDAESVTRLSGDVALAFSELVDANILVPTGNSVVRRFQIYPLIRALLAYQALSPSDDLLERWKLVLESNVMAAARLPQSEAKEYFDAFDRDIDHLVTLAESDRGFSESALTCLVEASNYWIFAGTLERGFGLANRIVMAPGAGLSRKYTRGLLSACAFASLTGRPQEALRFARQALRDADSPEILAKAWINYGTAATNLGRNRVALSAMKRGLRHARGVSDQAERTALSNIAAIAARFGNYAEALKASEELYLSVPNDDRLRSYVEMNYGDALVHAGRFDEARTVLMKALDRFVEMGNVSESARCWRTLGQLYFKDSKFEEACRAYTAAASLQMEGHILEGEHAAMQKDLARIRDQIGENRYFEIRMSDNLDELSADKMS